VTTTDSDAAFYAEGILDVDRWFQIAHADYWALRTALDINALFTASARHLRLLDIGCGTGRFPTLLRPYLNQRGPVIDYDFIGLIYIATRNSFYLSHMTATASSYQASSRPF
jgi:SAM-dependent methyltransferase